MAKFFLIHAKTDKNKPSPCSGKLVNIKTLDELLEYADKNKCDIVVGSLTNRSTMNPYSATGLEQTPRDVRLLEIYDAYRE